MEGQLSQLNELKGCLELELADVYADRDRLVAELEQVIQPTDLRFHHCVRDARFHISVRQRLCPIFHLVARAQLKLQCMLHIIMQVPVLAPT